MIATLTRIFGVHNLALAEDVVQDALCRAMEVWKVSGVPDNPGAWLMATAKHRALDVLRRGRTARTFAPAYGQLLDSEWTLTSVLREAFSAQECEHDQLRMMFTCCQPSLAEEAQIALVLHTLCGFSVAEIARALLKSEAALEKRLVRAKQQLADTKNLFELAGADLVERLSAVQRALYLLFNEGYHGASSETPIRAELCDEALRLVALLRAQPLTCTPATLALSALMCFHRARLDARLDAAGELIPLFEQDRSRWNLGLIAQGRHLLARAASGPDLTDYHLEAAIAAVHTSARRAEDTDWPQIVALYDALLALRPSPIVALNRAIAIAQRDGPVRGLEVLRGLADEERIRRYPFYFAALAELELQCDQREAARAHFADALSLARSPSERHFFERRLLACGLP